MLPAIPQAVVASPQHRADETRASTEDTGNDKRFAALLGRDETKDDDRAPAASDDLPDAAVPKAEATTQQDGAPEVTAGVEDPTAEIGLPNAPLANAATETAIETDRAIGSPEVAIKAADQLTDQGKRAQSPSITDADASKARDFEQGPAATATNARVTPVAQTANGTSTATEHGGNLGQSSPDPKASSHTETEQAAAQSARSPTQPESETVPATRNTAATTTTPQKLQQNVPSTRGETVLADESPEATARIEGIPKSASETTLSQAIVEHRSAKTVAPSEEQPRHRERARAAIAPAIPQTQAQPPEIADVATPKAPTAIDASTLTAKDGAEPLAKLDPVSPAFERATTISPQATNAAQPTTAADQARQIAQQMAAVVPSSVPGSTDITLQPEELGRVRMTLTIQDGTLTLLIQADRAETSDLMRRNIDQLAQAYRQMGFDTLAFTFANSSQHGDTSGAPNQGNDDIIDDGPIIASESPDIALPTGQTGRLDLRI